MSAKERKCKSANARKRAQKGAKERKRALPRKTCKQPGLKQPGLGTPDFGPHRIPGRELSEFLSAYYLCAKANSPSFSQNSLSLP